MHLPGSVPVVTFAGQVTANAPAAATVTLKLQVLLFPAPSVAVHVTVVLPTGKSEPEAGVETTVTPEQLSLAVGAGYVTVVPLAGAPVIVTSAGQVIAGFSVSFTVTVKLHVLVLPAASVAVAVTVVVPFGKVEPEAGVLATVTPGQLSVAVGVA